MSEERRDDYRKIRLQVRRVTPTMAKTLLKNNIGENRPLKPRSVKSLSRDMGNGDWGICPDCICMTPEGKVLNGQHRLHAVIESQTPIYLVFMEGVPAENFSHIDSGDRRTPQAMLGIDGCPSTHVNAAVQICRGWWNYQRTALHNIASGGGTERMTNDEVLTVWRYDKQGILDTCVFFHEQSQPFVKFAGLRILHYILAWEKPRKGKEFFQAILDYEKRPGDPTYTLRLALEKHYAARQAKTNVGKMLRQQQLAWPILAWNAWSQGKQLKRLSWKPLTGEDLKRLTKQEGGAGVKGAGKSNFPDLIV